MYEKGKKIKNFCLKNEKEKEICLDDFKDKWIILYFYPKDNTSGCTKEAVAFTENLNKIKKLNTVVIGISKDSPKSHQRFIEKYNLKHILLCDEEHKIIEKFGCWKLKKLYGREYYGVERSTFIISPEQKIVAEWRKVKVAGHVEEVIETLKTLQKN